MRLVGQLLSVALALMCCFMSAWFVLHAVDWDGTWWDATGAILFFTLAALLLLLSLNAAPRGGGPGRRRR